VSNAASPAAGADLAAETASRRPATGAPLPDHQTVVLPPRNPREEVKAPAPPTGADPAWLARELQRELKRVGCYHNALNGEWTPLTRRAMKDFIDRVNAVLPLDAPSPVLLALLKTHAEIVCSDSCPAGEGLADNRCLPDAVLAAAAKKAAPTTAAGIVMRSSAKAQDPEAETVAAQAPHAPAAAGASPRRRHARPGGLGSLISSLLRW
jgi:hypothetical protein